MRTPMNLPVVQKTDRLIQRGLTVTLLALAATLVGAALVLYV
jgi:hypothetical protein